MMAGRPKRAAASRANKAITKRAASNSNSDDDDNDDVVEGAPISSGGKCRSFPAAMDGDMKTQLCNINLLECHSNELLVNSLDKVASEKADAMMETLKKDTKWKKAHKSQKAKDSWWKKRYNAA